MKAHLQYNWWKYLLILLLPIFFWCSIFSNLKKPTPEQRVHILYVGQNLDAQKLEEQLSQALPQRTTQQLKSISVTVVEEDTLSYDVLDARCFDYDILIFEESSMPANVGQAVFVRLTQELLRQFPDCVYYREAVADVGVLTYGFTISPESSAPFAQCYTGTQNCYLFVSPRSENFDTLNENGRSGNDGALKAAQYLLEKSE